MMYGYYNNGWAGPSMFGGIFMFIFWILIVFFVIWIIRRILHSSHNYYNHDQYFGHRSNNALDILKERYAKGEINKEEFEAKKKDIMM